jgi:hypothetical protein
VCPLKLDSYSIMKNSEVFCIGFAFFGGHPVCQSICALIQPSETPGMVTEWVTLCCMTPVDL